VLKAEAAAAFWKRKRSSCRCADADTFWL